MSVRASEIIDNLFIGEWYCSLPKYINNLDIGVIINVTPIQCLINSCQVHQHSNIKYIQIPVNDCNTNIIKYFNYTCREIDNALNEGKKVLVHCQAGVSRSPTIVIAYLMYKLHIHFKEAFNLVKSKRQIINPNRSFLIQLRLYDILLTCTRYINLKNIGYQSI